MEGAEDVPPDQAPSRWREPGRREGAGPKGSPAVKAHLGAASLSESSGPHGFLSPYGTRQLLPHWGQYAESQPYVLEPIGSDWRQMKLVSNRETRCEDCGGRIPEGVEIDYLPGAGQFKPEARHLKCPKKKSPVAMNAPRLVDHDELFTVLKCSREPIPFDPDVKWVRRHIDPCGKTVAFPTEKHPRLDAVRPTQRCPYCDGEWSTLGFWAAA